MRAAKLLDMILSALRSFAWMIEREDLRYELVEDADTLFVGGTLAFLDGSRLCFEQNALGEETRYRFQHVSRDDELIFRYDNAPHHPHLATYPHHKHSPSGVVASTSVTLSDVLSDIERRLVHGNP